jgi:predicted nucleic acid-binding Zn ribbon protein
MSHCEGCGVQVRAGRRFCSWGCSSAWAQVRSERFGRATNRKGMPMTYGTGKKGGS